MPEYLSPGVYVEEVSSGIKPIEGVGTSTGAFIGSAERGPIKKPVLVTNWSQFTATFGGFIESGYLAYAVFHFFNEGGTKCYVVRAAKGTAEQLKRAEKAFNDLIVRASSEGEWGNNIKIKIDDESPAPGLQARADYCKLTVLYKDKEIEVFDNMTLDETKPDHVVKRVVSKWIQVEDKGSTRPGNGTEALAGGTNGVALTSADWAGAEGFISAFDTIDDVNIVAIPDAQGDHLVTQAAYSYCQNRKDCFFVADTPTGLGPAEVLKFRMDKGFNSSFGALYWPWIAVVDPLSSTGKTKLVPPSGAVVGTYSHTGRRARRSQSSGRN